MSGDVRILSVDEGTLQVRSVAGNVSVGVVKGVDLHVDVETLSGVVNSEIPLTTPRDRLDGRPGWTSASAACRANIEIERALEQVAVISRGRGGTRPRA